MTWIGKCLMEFSFIGYMIQFLDKCNDCKENSYCSFCNTIIPRIIDYLWFVVFFLKLYFSLRSIETFSEWLKIFWTNIASCCWYYQSCQSSFHLYKLATIVIWFSLNAKGREAGFMLLDRISNCLNLMFWFLILALCSAFMVFHWLEPWFYNKVLSRLISLIRAHRPMKSVDDVLSERTRRTRKNNLGFFYDTRHTQMIRLSNLFSSVIVPQSAAGGFW